MPSSDVATRKFDLAGKWGFGDAQYFGEDEMFRAERHYAFTSRTRVISEGAPKRFGGPQ
jgi:hypothetical protein